MCRKLLFLAAFVLVLGLEGSLWAGNATYVGIDSTTKGNWRTVGATPTFTYGSDGFCVIGDSTLDTTFPAAKPKGTMPSYVVGSCSPMTITFPVGWGGPGYTPGNPNNLLIGSDFASSDLTIGQIWWGWNGSAPVDWYIDLRFTDENVHQVAFYANEIGVDSDGRITGFEVYDNSGNTTSPGTWGSPSPGTLLATSGSDMTNLYTTPKYAIFHIKGHVQIKVNDVTAGLATVISGIFFDPGTGRWPCTSSPVPADKAMITGTFTTLSWRAGDFAVSHDVYVGDNFDDVNDGTGDTFRVNQTGTFYVAGVATYPFPDGLVPGTTYYWRIDEVNDAEPNSPWKGDIWSFMVPPKTAYYPDPVNGAEFVPENVTLTWTPGLGAILHTVYIDEDFDTVHNATDGGFTGGASYTPGSLKLAKTYYWRVDEDDLSAIYKGDVWSFTTEGAVSGPNPADGDEDVSPTQILTWDAGAVAASHEVYFGTDSDAVKNATKTSPEYKGPKALGEESCDPGKLLLTTTYYWRIDEVNAASTDSPWAGNVWSFTTGDFFVIDDFEIYDANDNQIWYSWIDGLGYGAPGTDMYNPGNGTGGAVGDENTASYMEETIINGGSKSMPLFYDNNKLGYSRYSETELTLTAPRDWTEEGVGELSLWFRGYPGSTGSFVESPVGTYTMTASGADIWGNADQFHFANKMLTGAGSIVAKVNSVENTNVWAKAGVMIRESLEPGSVHATMVVTPAQGISFQRRIATDGVSTNTDTTGIVAPYWVKIERDIAGNFTASSSTNGSTWTIQGTFESIPMGANVYIGLAVTSHDVALTSQAVFSNVTTSSTVSGQWVHQDIGITSNAAEPLYVAVSNSTGASAVVVHDDPAAATIDTWTEWVIPLQAFTDQGIVLTNVDRIAIGLGTRGNATIPGGSGKMFFDDIRLYRPAPEQEPQP